jgi:outer membrane protein OmpA-like peptidoglycan-associated protein
VLLRAALATTLAACDAVRPMPAVRSQAMAPNAPILSVRDSDHDGVSDPYDACPGLPGTASRDLVQNGCPPPGYYSDALATHDADGDGVLDEKDACPDVPGSAGEPAGCPIPPDLDQDGVANKVDACPTDAGPARDTPGLNGCPPAWIDGDRIRVLGPVRFESGKALLLPDSEPVLAAVADVLAKHPAVADVEVQGHTDARGGPVANRALSEKRAREVVRFLVAHGIAPERLRAKGFGADVPIDTNDTEDGRSTNRRVEFHVVGTAASPPKTPPPPTAVFAPADPQ